MDCTKFKEIKTNFKDVKKIDGLVNCAGIVPQGNIMDCNEEDWEHSIKTNLTSVYLMTKFFMPVASLAKEFDSIKINIINNLMLNRYN